MADVCAHGCLCCTPMVRLLQMRYDSIRQAISAALPRLRAAVPATVAVGAYGNGFQRSTSEWLAEDSGRSAAQPLQLARDPGAVRWDPSTLCVIRHAGDAAPPQCCTGQPLHVASLSCACVARRNGSLRMHL